MFSYLNDFGEFEQLGQQAMVGLQTCNEDDKKGREEFEMTGK